MKSKISPASDERTKGMSPNRQRIISPSEEGKYNSPITTPLEAGDDEIEKIYMTSGFVKTKRGGGGKGANHNFSSALKGRIVAKADKRRKVPEMLS